MKWGDGVSVKAEVLASLDAARGQFVSGQELAQRLRVSRAAIWKAVTALRADGLPIEAATNRGYALPRSADLLSGPAVRTLLSPQAAGALRVEVVDRLPGTNAALRARAAGGEAEGLVLIAQAQSAGRGRSGRSFFSPPGGLYLSVLLRPEISTRQAVQLSAMAAVAAAEAAEQVCGAPIQIKWVNDLWRGGRKVCGVLTEAAVDLESGMLDSAVLGLGFNLAEPPGGWPPELAGVAGALFDAPPPAGARAALAAGFLNRFWPMYRAGAHSGHLEAYRRRQALIGRRVEVLTPGSAPRTARALGIDEQCRLVVRFDTGAAVCALNSGEVRVRPEE